MADAAACVNAAPASPVKNAMPTAATDAPSSETPVFVATRISHRANGLRHTVNAMKPIASVAPAVSAHRSRDAATTVLDSGRITLRARSASKGANESAITTTQNCAAFDAALSVCRDADFIFFSASSPTDALSPDAEEEALGCLAYFPKLGPP